MFSNSMSGQEEIQFQVAATQLVDSAINEAIKNLQLIEGAAGSGPGGETSHRVPIKLLNEEAESASNITWMSIDEFGKEKAEKKLKEFIEQTWHYDGSWLFCIDYLGESEEKYDMRYRFRVRWSIPTRRRVIPRCTASVYFTYSVSKIKPGNYPVDVYYIFETNQLVHRPGESIFRENWLKDIIESKLAVLQDVTF